MKVWMHKETGDLVLAEEVFFAVIGGVWMIESYGATFELPWTKSDFEDLGEL